MSRVNNNMCQGNQINVFISVLLPHLPVISPISLLYIADQNFKKKFILPQEAYLAYLI